MNENPTKVMTGKARASYVHIFEPRANQDGNEKYSISLIIPKSDTDTVNALKAAINAAIGKGEQKLGLPPKGDPKREHALKGLKLPLRDGDTDRYDDPAYKDAYFVNANSTRKPGVVDQAVRPITDPSELYSGCYVRATISFFAYNRNGNKGIAAGLQNLQKIADGEPLGGVTVSAEAEFEPIVDESTSVDDISYLD